MTRKPAEWGLVVAVEERITADVEEAGRPVEVPGEIRARPPAADVLREALAG